MPKPTVRIASFLLPGPGQVRKRRALSGNPVKSYGADPAPGVSVDLDETAPIVLCFSIPNAGYPTFPPAKFDLSP